MSIDDRTAETRQRGLIFITLVLLGIFLFWSSVTTLDLVTSGQGRVVPRGQNISVQVPHPGTILSFAATEGDRVEEGDLIAEINPTDAIGALAEARKRLRSLRLRLARLDAEMTGAEFDISTIATADPLERTLLEAELASSNARRADLIAREAALVQSRSQRQRDLQALEAQLSGVEDQRGLLAEETAQVMPLVNTGVLGMNEKFRLDRQDRATATEALVLAEQIEATRFAIAETDAQIAAARSTFQSAVLEERVEVLSQISELTERLPSLELRVTETEVRAPVTGILNQLAFNRAGAVVAGGDRIAEIVPETSDLRIEALIAPKDIANVEPGQDVRVTLTAYDATKFGYLSGQVLRVSADATMREEMQQRMFVVETSITGSIQDVDGENVRILPGMIAQVDVIRGQRTILDYFWNPVIKVRDRAFRE